MKRWVFRVAVVISSAVFAAAITFWIRSYFTRDIVWIDRPGYTFLGQVATSRGKLYGGLLIGWLALDEIRAGNCKLSTVSITHETDQVEPDRPDDFHSSTRASFAGIGYSRGVSTNDTDITVDAPLWLVALLASVFPSMAFRRYLVRRRYREAGTILCEGCGYDLRASSDRCPECGTEFTAGHPAA